MVPINKNGCIKHNRVINNSTQSFYLLKQHGCFRGKFPLYLFKVIHSKGKLFPLFDVCSSTFHVCVCGCVCVMPLVICVSILVALQCVVKALYSNVNTMHRVIRACLPPLTLKQLCWRIFHVSDTSK